LEVNKLPSEKILEQKKQTVAELTAKLKNAAAGVVVDYKGINVADDTKLRKELREAGVEYAVVKNSMLRFAAKEVGYEALDSVLEGTTALATSEGDQVAAAKILTKYAEDSKGKFVVKAGFVDGGVIDAAKVAELGKLPSREALLSMLCSALQGNIRGLAVALNAIAEKSGEAAPAEEAAPAAEAPAEAAPAAE
jgi:large subunit ribosomal protein L10